MASLPRRTCAKCAGRIDAVGRTRRVILNETEEHTHTDKRRGRLRHRNTHSRTISINKDAVAAYYRIYAELAHVGADVKQKVFGLQPDKSSPGDRSRQTHARRRRGIE